MWQAAGGERGGGMDAQSERDGKALWQSDFVEEDEL